MYDVSPSEAEFQRALSIVAEICRLKARPNEPTQDIRVLTKKVLDTCYSIGGTYEEEDVRAVAQALIDGST